MPNMVDSLTAIDPSQDGQALSPQQLIARQAYDRMMSPQQFFQRQYTGFQGPSIEDNSGLIGKTSLDSQNAALQMQGQGDSAAHAALIKGRLGGAFDAVKDAVKQTISHGAPMKSEAQIHEGINNQSSGANPAFASAPAMGGMPSSGQSKPQAAATPEFKDEHLNPPNKMGIRTFTNAGHDYANRLADQYHNMTGFFNQQ